MPRPKRFRNICFPPNFLFFKPIDINADEEIFLSVEEYEAIRLKDLEQKPQIECAKSMGISQPTFHRIISSARQKIADAIVNGKAIKISGGKYRISTPQGLHGKRQRFGRRKRGMCLQFDDICK